MQHYLIDTLQNAFQHCTWESWVKFCMSVILHVCWRRTFDTVPQSVLHSHSTSLISKLCTRFQIKYFYLKYFVTVSSRQKGSIWYLRSVLKYGWPQNLDTWRDCRFYLCSKGNYIGHWKSPEQKKYGSFSFCSINWCLPKRLSHVNDF